MLVTDLSDGTWREIDVMLGLLMDGSYEQAVKSGWREPGKTKSPVEAHMLMVTEIAEATEEVRNGRPPLYKYPQVGGKSGFITPDNASYADNPGKPEGEAVELADVIIRIFDEAKARNLPLVQAIKDKMFYNATRPYRHGNKAY